jgi:hypothetical protein
MTETEERPILDWVPREDPRNENYSIRAAIGNAVPRRNKKYTPGLTLDQGREGACVGYAWTHEALSTPVRVELTKLAHRPANIQHPDSLARWIYREALKIDEWEGEADEGTSVLAGAKIMKNRLGVLKEYRWAFSIDELVDGIISTGPAILGIPWLDEMYEAPNGVLRAEGRIVGGHAILAYGYSMNDPRINGENGVLLHNSWGEDWGVKGNAIIRETELAQLLAHRGEACIPTKRSYGR